MYNFSYFFPKISKHIRFGRWGAGIRDAETPGPQTEARGVGWEETREEIGAEGKGFIILQNLNFSILLFSKLWEKKDKKERRERDRDRRRSRSRSRSISIN